MPGRFRLPAGPYGLLTLAAAMGLGRFFYTPQLPLMLAEGRISLPDASGLAFANYLGYLAGSLWLARRALHGPRQLMAGLRTGLVLNVAGLALLACPLPVWLWVLARGVSGIASAMVMVCLAALLLPRAGTRTRGLIYAGIGCGMVAAGGLTHLWPDSLHSGWLATALAALLAGLVWQPPRRARPAVRPAATASLRPDTSLGALTALYGLAGLGYIVVATYLPTLARDTLGPDADTGLLWLVAGAAAMPAPLLWAGLARRLGDAPALALNLALQVTATALPAFASGPALLVLAAACLGLGFAGTPALVLPLASRLPARAGWQPVAAVTAAYGVGQLLGPLLAGVLRQTSGSFALPSLVAALALLPALLFIPAATGYRLPALFGRAAIRLR